MRKLIVFVILSLIIFASINWYTERYHHSPPVPSKDSYRVEVDVRVLTEKEFEKECKVLLKRDDIRGVKGLCVFYNSGRKEIILPKNSDNQIDLESLGHEVFYHCMEDK